MTWYIEVFQYHISFYLCDENDMVKKRFSNPNPMIGM